MLDEGQGKKLRGVGISDVLVPQGALEQRSHLNVCLGDVHSLLLALQELYARMKAQIFWGMIMVIRGKLCKDWGLVLTAGCGWRIRTTVFPGKFCWAYSTRSLKTPLFVQRFS